MTKLLEKAFEKASALPEKEQDTIADWLLEEMESEERWAKLFSGSQDALHNLAAEALDEDRRGETRDFDIGR